MINKYDDIINRLMNNDRNATYDEILKDNDNNLEKATEELKDILNRIIDDEGLEGEELEFYKESLIGLN